MKLFQIFFAVLMGFLVLIIALWFVLPPEGATGYQHETYEKMRKGGESLSSLPATKWLAFLFGLFVLTVFGLCLAIGYRKNGRLKEVRPWLWAGMIGYIAVYTLMVVSYWKYIGGGDSSYFGGVPAPTAWMLYGVWFFPLFFTVIYIWKFDDWVVTPQDLERFHQLVEENKKKGVS